MMSLAKVASGAGYEYYIRTVATHDANERGNTALGDYYSERGESPGRWWGTGLTSLALAEDAEVTESQMWALYGRGLHPDAEALIAAEVATLRAGGMPAKKAKAQAIREKARIGSPFMKPTVDEFSYRAECRRAYEEWNLDHGRGKHAPIPDEQRSYLATEVAGRMFDDEHGHPPRNEEELSTWVAKASRPASKRVAGYDLCFSPVKTVSMLWALAPREVAEKIEAAHRAAVVDALRFLEKRAVFTRVGTNGVAQVDVEGLIAAMFDHRDSRSGDPDLHTHVLVSNKVRRPGGDWYALDGRMIYRNIVTASAIYNTRLEHHLETALGSVFFAERPQADAHKRPIREMVGADERLAARWSTRATAITAKTAALAADFQARHGREPSPNELVRLAEEATLATRGGKHHARSRAEQRADWRAEAIETLGDAEAVDEMVAEMLSQTVPERDEIDIDWLADRAREVIDVVAEHRATWRINHIRAETARQLQGRIAPQAWETTLEQVVSIALDEHHSIARHVVDRAPMLPGLTRADGTSVYVPAESQTYTSREILDAEKRLLVMAQFGGGRAIPAAAVEIAELEYAANGHKLNPGQRALVHACATSRRKFMVVVAPAGAGKTTVSRVLVSAWDGEGGNTFGLAPTASAAAVLAADSGAPALTLDMFLTLAQYRPEALPPINESTQVIIDEIATASTLKLHAVVKFLTDRGANVRGIGDHQQLSSPQAGGIVRDIIESTDSPTLTKVMRFIDHGEAAASLAIRDGDPAGIAFYADHQRIHVGTLTEAVHNAFRGWRADYAQGHDAVMLAPTRALVGELNALARAERLTRAERDGEPVGAEIPLADGHRASIGDIVTTRRNNRQLDVGDDDFVRNGYRWRVRFVHDDGAVTATHIGSGRLVVLPADYVREHVGLGYANTINSAQGTTVDRCHGVLTGRETRAQFYVMLTRGRAENHLYLETASTLDEHAAYTYDAIHPPTALDILTDVLGREGTQTSATSDARAARDPHRLLAGEADAYLHALGEVCEQRISPQRHAQIAAHAETLARGVTTADAWPVLRQHLAVLELSGRDPLDALTKAASTRELDSADDPAAVLDWRIDPTGNHSRTDAHGPLRWLPEIPPILQRWEQAHQHLTVRAEEIAHQAGQIREEIRSATGEQAPAWARQLRAIDPELTAEVAVWRAAHSVSDLDRRPTGPVQRAAADLREQQRLDAAVAERVGALDAHTKVWRKTAEDIDERITADPYWPTLAREWSSAAAAGLDINGAARKAHADRVLPAEQPAAALRWRMTQTLDHAAELARERQAQQARELEARAQAALAAEPAPKPAVDEQALYVAARDRLRKFRPHQAQRLSDVELQHHTQHWEDQLDDQLFDPEAHAASVDIHTAQEQREQILQRHRALDENARAIRLAQPFVDTAKAAHAEHTKRRDELAKARRQLDELHRVQWIARRERQAAVDELAEQANKTADALLAARKPAKEAAAATGIPLERWDAVLAKADNHGARAAELERVDTILANARTVIDRIDRQRAGATTNLRMIREEKQRRDQLSDIELTAEELARAVVNNEPEPETPTPTTSSPKAGAQQRRTQRIRGATRPKFTGTDNSSGYNPPGQGRSSGHGPSM
ncbi:MobF family relaxase [Nocardia aurea]|uniref:MobF family relaxase n=1 Tax=Nocardia aurea TaxID=2144174 RepID=A0ABV3G4W4_9NOCA